MASWLEDIAGAVLDPKFILPAIGSIYSNRQSQRANVRAVELAQQGQAGNAMAIRQGQQQAQARYDAMAASSAPANVYLRQVVAQDPNQLTPQQQAQLAEVQRSTMVGLNNSGLSGSARATTGAIRKINADTTGDMIARNVARGDNAAGILAGQGQQAGMASAGVPLQAATSIGRGDIDAANNAANATVANAGTNASTIAAITAFANRDAADRAAANRYKTVTTGGQ